MLSSIPVTRANIDKIMKNLDPNKSMDMTWSVYEC